MRHFHSDFLLSYHPIAFIPSIKSRIDNVSKSVSRLSSKKGPAKFGQSRQVCNFGCPNQKLQLMLLTKEQISEQMCKHAQK